MSPETRPSQDPKQGVSAQISDTPHSWPVERSEQRYRSRVVGMRTDWVKMPDAEGQGTVVAARDYMQHPGAAAALALDEWGRVLLQRQYRHATEHQLWELPAGILDVEGETPLAAAQRELVEEAGWRARTWHELPSFFPSPGFSDERIHVFLARDLSKVPEEENGFVREHEEAHLVAEWVPLAEAAQWVLQGRLLNGATVIGILAAHIASADDFSSLRELITG